MPRIALAQPNPVVGDLVANAARIANLAAQARAAQADLLVLPQGALCGSPLADLLRLRHFHRACAAQLAELAAQLSGISVIIEHPAIVAGSAGSALSLLGDGKRQLLDFSPVTADLLPAAADAAADAAPVTSSGFFSISGLRCRVSSGAAPAPADAAIDLLCVVDAAPFGRGQAAPRAQALGALARANRAPLLYANLVGGQDELVFDGGSLAVDAQGASIVTLRRFAEDFAVVDLAAPASAPPPAAPAPLAEIHAALVLALRDYVSKNGFPGVVLGMSGGIDSALVLALAVEALGRERVRAVMLPSPYTAAISLADAQQMSRELGVAYSEIPIAPAMQTFAGLLSPHRLAARPGDTTDENLQARIRGSLLMALSNQSGDLLLSTGNKSELAVGYCTLYGDMAGGFAPLKDVPKTLVYELARWINRERALIPWRIIERPPSAELRPDQTDQDSLPPYDVLDAIIAGLVDEGAGADQLIARGLPAAAVGQVARLLRLAEHKRRQGPLGPRLGERGFAGGWQMPITNRYRSAAPPD